MVKKRVKGFTLIELLAVIIILGVLMIIAIPAVTEYISNSRKETYLLTAKGFMDEVAIKTNQMQTFKFTNPDIAYYVPVSNIESNSCISLERGGQSPFGEWVKAYVVVIYDNVNQNYNYYFTALDTAGYGVDLISYADFNTDDIKASSDVIFPKSGDMISLDRQYVVALGNPSDCSSFEIADYSDVVTIDKNELVYEIIDNKVYINGYLGDDLKVRIPDYIDNAPVVGIGNYAFERNLFTKLILPNSIENIGNGAFRKSKLTSLILPANLKTIGDAAFNESNILALNIPSKVETIGNYAFEESSINSLVLNEGLITIGNSTFKRSIIDSLDLPSTLTSVGDFSFEYAPISNLTLNEGLVTIGLGAFAHTSVEKLIIPSTVTTIKDYAFGNSKLKSVVIKGKGTSYCLSKFDYLGSDSFDFADGYGEENIMCSE